MFVHSEAGSRECPDRMLNASLGRGDVAPPVYVESDTLTCPSSRDEKCIVGGESVYWSNSQAFQSPQTSEQPFRQVHKLAIFVDVSD